MNISTFPSGPFETNAYIVSCLATSQAALIDPGVDSSPALINHLEKKNLTPKFIWLTHSHWDHIAEVSQLKEKYSIPVAIHPLDAPNLENPGSDKLPCWVSFPGVIPDLLLQDGHPLSIGQLSFTVLHTPGHSPGSVCFYCPAERLLISGDTLFKGSIGNISFPTSQPDLMWDSLTKLSKLPPSTQIFPGHGPRTMLQTETWLPNARELFGSY